MYITTTIIPRTAFFDRKHESESTGAKGEGATTIIPTPNLPTNIVPTNIARVKLSRKVPRKSLWAWKFHPLILFWSQTL